MIHKRSKKEKSKRLLLLDTATSHASLALSEGEKILRYQNVVLEKSLANSLTLLISRLLVKAGISLKTIDGFAVGLGPGSFTSLRVGLATVKALSFATGKPVVGVPSLDTLARSVKRTGMDAVCALCDARRNLFYACLYVPALEGLERKSEYLLAPLDEILGLCAGKILFVGDGIKSARAIIEQKSSGGLKGSGFSPYFVDERQWFPQAKYMLAYARERLERGDGDDINKLLPLYLYPEDCQVRRPS